MKPVDQRDNELRLVTVHVDSSTIGVGWMIAQRLVDAEYPIVFGSITFNEQEACYLQPKLELYGVFRALKAEHHRLHNIHFHLIINAGFLTQMMISPDLPNAAMTRWITYIQLFTLIKEREIENSICVHEALSQTKLERRAGEVKALECRWSSPASLLHDYWRMYAGLGEEIDLEEEHERLHHQHRVHDMDGEAYWDEILVYLHLGQLPNTKFEAEKIMRCSKRFFILHDIL